MGCKKGNIPWNKGLSKEEIAKHYKDGNIFPIDIEPWNKGLHEKTNTGRTHFKKGHEPWIYIDGRSKHPIRRKRINGVPIAHIVWCQANQMYRVPPYCIIHHVDMNPLNNDPENLQLLEDRYHKWMHNEIYKLSKGGVISV